MIFENCIVSMCMCVCRFMIVFGLKVLDTISYLFNEFFRTYNALLSLSHSLFNPQIIGSVLVAMYVYAWFRMESISESKRRTDNQRVLTKKSFRHTSSNLDGISLDEYSQKTNGIFFESSSLSDVVSHMQTKGKVPLKMHPVCQPIQTVPCGVLWQSKIVSISQQIPAPIPIRQALKLDTFQASWKDPRSMLFTKETVCYGSINYHIELNFLSFFDSIHKFKRIGSVSLSQFKKMISQNGELLFDNPRFSKIKINDKNTFNALITIAAHIK